jgi:hypothetical protein
LRLFTLAEASRISFLFRCLSCQQLIAEEDMQDHFERVHQTRLYGIDLRAQFRKEVAP